MTNQLYQNLDDLLEKNKELSIKLKLADSEVASLRVKVKNTADGNLELLVKLEEANNEVGRLSMQLNHRYEDLSILRRHNKFGK
jgi:nitrogen fixation/metabolism regulation signal transduction histidine kinase